MLNTCTEYSLTVSPLNPVLASIIIQGTKDSALRYSGPTFGAASVSSNLDLMQHCKLVTRSPDGVADLILQVGVLRLETRDTAKVLLCGWLRPGLIGLTKLPDLRYFTSLHSTVAERSHYLPCPAAIIPYTIQQRQ